MSNRKAVPKVIDLLKTLREKVKIGVVSNGLRDMQMEKIRICKAEELIDYEIFSGDIGAMKPDKAMFEAALNVCNAKPDEAIFIGDSWKADVIGATNCGIKAIWLSRYHQSSPDSSLALEIHSYDEPDMILKYIFQNGLERFPD